jgi:hypothetical protein
MKFMPNGLWQGGASTYSDPSASPVASLAWTLGGPGHDSAHALHFAFADPGPGNWGGGVSLWMQGCYDMSSYAGIQFWAMEAGAHPGLVLLGTKAVTAPPNGTCALQPSTDCVGFTSSPIAFTASWALYQVPWTSLTSKSSLTPPNATDVLSFGVQVNANWGTSDHIDFWLDDISLYGTAPSAGGAGGMGGGGP